MNSNDKNNNSLVHSSETAIAIFFIIGGLWYQHRFVIEHYRMEFMERLQNPFFIISLILLFVLAFYIIYRIGYKIEIFYNNIKKWQYGIKEDDKEKNMKFKFNSFDLKQALDEFYANGQNSDRTFLGLNAQKDNKEAVSIPDMQRTNHMQVKGPIGTGKTTGAMMPLIYQDALKRRPVIIIDAKGEQSFINQLYTILKSINREKDFQLVSLLHKDLSCSFNPLYVGECDPKVVIESFIENFKDENSFYRQVSITLFTHAFYILYSLGRQVTIMDMFAYLNNDACRQYINNKARASSNKEGKLYLKLFNEHIERLDKQFKDWHNVIEGLNNFLREFNFDVLEDADSDVVLMDAVRQGKIVYFQLATNAHVITAPNIARMVQSNLRYISSLIQTGILPKDTLISVLVDEYGSFACESFVEVHNKARSSCMMITIAHQSTSDLSQISEDFKKRMEDSTLNKIYFKDSDAQHCESIAESLGTYIREEKTYRMTGGRFGNQLYTGESSNRMVNAFNFPPDKIKNLYKYGQAYYIYKGENSHVCVNFGIFNDVKEIPYQKVCKKDKKEGLRLFEQFYLNTQDDVSTKNVAKKSKKENLNESLELKGKK
jgi:hypothetical protein